MSSTESGTLGAAAGSAGGVAAARPGPATVRRGDDDVARETRGRGRGRGRGVAIAGVAIFAVVAAAIAAFVTREGPGLTPDSRGYLLVAEQIHLGNGVTMLDGDGKKVPLTHCPPLYPIMLWAGDA